jgi:hypothetical protein
VVNLWSVAALSQVDIDSEVRESSAMGTILRSCGVENIGPAGRTAWSRTNGCRNQNQIGSLGRTMPILKQLEFSASFPSMG